jgi:hypothetical protein
MNRHTVVTIASKDLGLLRRKRSLRLSILAFPLLVAVVLPWSSGDLHCHDAVAGDAVHRVRHPHLGQGHRRSGRSPTRRAPSCHCPRPIWSASSACSSSTSRHSASSPAHSSSSTPSCSSPAAPHSNARKSLPGGNSLPPTRHPRSRPNTWPAHSPGGPGRPGLASRDDATVGIFVIATVIGIHGEVAAAGPVAPSQAGFGSNTTSRLSRFRFRSLRALPGVRR